jgi:hypothetical protein
MGERSFDPTRKQSVSSRHALRGTARAIVYRDVSDYFGSDLLFHDRGCFGGTYPRGGISLENSMFVIALQSSQTIAGPSRMIHTKEPDRLRPSRFNRRGDLVIIGHDRYRLPSSEPPGGQWHCFALVLKPRLWSRCPAPRLW